MIDRRAWDILQRRIDPAVSQTALPKEAVLVMLLQAVKAGSTRVYRYGSTVFVVGKTTEYLWDMHMFSDERSYAVVGHVKSCLAQMRSEGIRRVEVRTAFPAIGRLAERCGFEREGVRPESFWDGRKFIPMYEYGILL